jgi:hypothetical protein
MQVRRRIRRIGEENKVKMRKDSGIGAKWRNDWHDSGCAR